MKPLAVLFLTLAVPAGFSQPQSGPVAPIALYTQFEQKPPLAVEEALHDELETIMAPMGMRFEWHALSGVQGNEVAVELAVLTFKGHCDATGMVSHNNNPGALGWTHVSDGIILPFSDVDCDRIRGFVQRELMAIRGADREESLGRAIGRVVAHELYHIFANTVHHGSCGVGKAAYTVQELLATGFQFEARESQALRTSKAHALLENAVRAPSLE